MHSNPILSGFNPDPSIVSTPDGYYIATSSFEYLPALPIYHSQDLDSWELVGHVAMREEQVQLADVPTPGGVWAPTLRYRDGIFYLIVTVFLGGRGCVVFTATDAAGPWSDGAVIEAVDGIDPDLAWDDDGTAYVTFARHPDAIRQVRVDLATGTALEEPRPLWSGSGLYAPEGPHLYLRGGWWYLLAAEGGTDRGHAVTVARSRRPDGPFEPAPHNPVLTASGTGSPVQNTGHADLFELPDGGTAMVLLGVRPVGLTQAFSPLGRETFLAAVDWIDDWPHARMPQVEGTRSEKVEYDFSSGDGLEDPAWISIRRMPAQFSAPTSKGLLIRGEGATLSSSRPTFLAQRQRHLGMEFRAVLDISSGTGGIAVRNAEDNWFGIEARQEGAAVRITARAVVASLDRTWEVTVPDGEVELAIVASPPPADFSAGAVGGDRIRLMVRTGARDSGGEGEAEDVLLTELDGRHWAFETAKAFTGRAFGVFAVDGEVLLRRLSYCGKD
ncbi:family 43 glycosylhydrolase [Pseudarthrobacter sp. BRE9]|uniref:glycoside hydrolase family 43 protein n=1 Tax=Pseudarthrobacter sp. BRE9 TaxID=2962582 RepID=UPI002880D19F|nr:family 43 glycosylhydrolase [Pseudarthrobacter sp. BRE9]MDT0169019.1 family 43 glycosylhydrolase [Pseudarthrobacter sp. BRE9]